MILIKGKSWVFRPIMPKMVRVFEDLNDSAPKSTPKQKVARKLNFELGKSQREYSKMEEASKKLQIENDSQIISEIKAILEIDELTDDNVLDMILEEYTHL